MTDEPGKNNREVGNSHDADELRSFGYQQQLKRSMGSFSSFAISFSLISIITGIFANFGFGIQQVGGAIVWSWMLVGVGQFLVALVMADLSIRFPISGYGYQWTSRLTNPHIGYFVGWLLLLQFLTGFPGVCQALADTIYDFLGGGNNNWTVTWLTIVVISIITIIHLYGIRIVSLVNDIGVHAEIVGASFTIVLLFGAAFWAGNVDFAVLFNRTNLQTGQAAGFSAFALSLLMGAWCLTGFEAAADLAEETHQPRRIVPWAVLTSQLSAAIGGLLMLMAFLFSTENLSAIQQSEAPLLMILQTKLGNRVTGVIGVVIVLSILACGVASMATATRLIYSLARDNMLPFSSFLKKVHPVYQAPRKATIAVWALSCLCVITLRHLELITSISAVAGYLGYGGILLATIIAKTGTEQPISGFTLGRWRQPIRLTALIWTLIVVAALTIPETQVTGLQETHLPAKSTLFAIVLGIVAYSVSIKRKIDRGAAGPPVQKK